MIKKLKILLLVASLVIQFLPAAISKVEAADYTIGSDGSRTYKLIFDSALSGYTLQIDNSGTVEWISKNGPVGIRTIDINNIVSSFQYQAYSTLTAVIGGYKGDAVFTTSNGSTIVVTDYYYMANGKLDVDREMKVTSANSNDKGFMVTLPIRSAVSITPTAFKWFAPSAWYGNDTDNFTGQESKLAFDGNETSTSVDSLGAPLISNFNISTLRGLTLADRTDGYRETVVNDNGPGTTKYLVDDKINLPGLGIRKVTLSGSDYTELFHTYPGYSENYRNKNAGKTIWRFIPVTLNNYKKTKIQLNYKPYADFNDSMKQIWRDAFSNIALTDKRYDSQQSYNTIVDFVDRSYGVIGSRPQYATNFDHHSPESGFLWRNVDLAWLMLVAGHDMSNTGYLTHANAVINDQVTNNSIESGYSRQTGDGLQYLLKAYQVELAHGINNTAWYNYVINKANSITSTTDFLYMPFFVELAKYTGNATYKTTAINIGNAAWSSGQNNLRFRGGITDYAGGAVEFDRESAVISLEGYMGLYDLTGSSTWLDRAKLTADYLETWHVIQNVKMEPEDAKGTEASMTTYGNNPLLSYGLSYVHSGTVGVDIYTAISALDYYKLSVFTGDAQYADFADFIENNTLRFTNMGDKVGVMADSLHLAGTGFQNEYFSMGPTDYGTVDGRGKGHDSDIGWVPFVTLAMIQRIRDYNGHYNTSNQTGPVNTLVSQGKKAVASSEYSTIYDASKAFDGDATNTRWAAADGTKPQWIKVDLGETHLISSIQTYFERPSYYYQYKIEYSIDDTNWSTYVDKTANTVTGNPSYTDTNSATARFVRLTVTGTERSQDWASILDLKIFGHAIVKTVLSEGKTTSASTEYSSSYTAAKAFDGDYNTRWAATNSSKPQWLKVDLGSQQNISKTVTHFEFSNEYYQYKIEYSADNTNWYLYADRTANTSLEWPYIDTKPVTARYVRISVTGIQNSADWASIFEFRIF